MKYPLLLLCLIGHISWAGEGGEFVREYTYNASENDSKVSARNAALQQLQSLLIQEIGVQIYASFDQTETLDNAEFSRRVTNNYQTFAKALSKTTILQQKWDGEHFYLKAKITVDTSNLTNQIKLVYIGKPDTDHQPGAEQTCKSVHNKAIDMLAEANRPEVVKQLVEYSTRYPIDRDCHQWQIGIIKNFRSLELDPEGYRAWLFERVDNKGSSYAGDLMLHVLDYALSIRPLSAQEWSVVKRTMLRSSPHINRMTVAALVKATRRENADGLENRTLRLNQAYQEMVSLTNQLKDITELINNKRIGAPKAFTLDDLALAVLNASVELHPTFFVDYYQQVYKKLDKKTIQNLARTVINDFKKSPDTTKLNFLDFYISTLESDRYSNKFLFSLILDLRKNRLGHPEFKPALAMLIKNHPKKMATAINKGRYNKQKKERMLIEYQLPSDKILPLADYARMLFDNKSRNQQAGADYLLAFGSRAEPARADVQKVLSRIKEIGKVQSPRNLVVALLQVLDNIDARDKTSIGLMIWALADIDGEINQQAQGSLQKVGDAALPVIKQHYQHVKSTAQRRLIEVMGTFSNNKAESLAFLKTIQPHTPQQKFALEDSIAALE